MNDFNTYKEGLDLDFLKDYCVGNGQLTQFERGDYFECVGRPSSRIGYIMRGCFKFIVRNEVNGKDFITGFSFNNEFVADYPNCLIGRLSEVNIVADMPSEVYVIGGDELRRMFDQDIVKLRVGKSLSEALFTQTYSRFLDHYRLDARGRYMKLLSRCPSVVQQLSLKDIASFLNVTPKTVSQVRRDITFGE